MSDRHDIEGLAEDCRRLAQQIVDLHTKGKHFQRSDSAQFRDVWIVEELDIRRHLRRLLDMDRVISEQILGLPFDLPNLLFCHHIGPISGKSWASGKGHPSGGERSHQTTPTRTEASSPASRATDRVEGVDAASRVISPPATLPIAESTTSLRDRMTAAEKLESERLFDELAQTHPTATYWRHERVSTDRSGGDDDIDAIDPLVVARVLELITNEAGFLVESKLLRVLDRFDDDTRALVGVDAVLRGLGIGTPQDVAALVKYFIRHIPADQWASAPPTSMDSLEALQMAYATAGESSARSGNVQHFEINEQHR